MRRLFLLSAILVPFFNMPTPTASPSPSPTPSATVTPTPMATPFPYYQGPTGLYFEADK